MQTETLLPTTKSHAIIIHPFIIKFTIIYRFFLSFNRNSELKHVFFLLLFINTRFVGISQSKQNAKLISTGSLGNNKKKPSLVLLSNQFSLFEV